MKVFGMVSTASSLRYTGPALKSFFQTTPFSSQDRFYLIDNDNCPELDQKSLGSDINLIKNKAPLGFAANANQVIELALKAQADLYFLNNDLIFPKNWIDTLAAENNSIVSPLSPREVQYGFSIINVKTKATLQTQVITNPFDLDSYLQAPSAFAAIAEAHARNAQGYWSVLLVPFFAVKIPFEILKTVGRFDEEFGAGGGEDYDYCFRALLAGFKVQFALGSFLLHFGGKSSWAGPESGSAREAREKSFKEYFEKKWGSKLFELALYEKAEILESDPELLELQNKGDLRLIVERLLNGKEIQIRI